MKKKEISKVQYLRATVAKGKYKFIAKQQVVEIKDEEHLFVEIFDNTREGRMKPKLRICFTHSDWALYYTKEDTWGSGSFRDEYGRNIWESSTHKQDTETFISEDDKKRIWKFCGKHRYMIEDTDLYSWTDRLKEIIDNIKTDREQKRKRNRRNALEIREDNTPELPGDIEQWTQTNLFAGMHYLYYKRHGRYADICCSSCGRSVTRAIKRTDSYIGQFESTVEVPKSGYAGTCPVCGAAGQWKPQGKTKGSWGVSRHFFVAQPYKEKGIVIRYMEAEKIFSLEENVTENGLEMMEASERYINTELARMYIEHGKRTQKDYHKYNGYTGKTFWDDRNLDYRDGPLRIGEGAIYEKSFQMIKDTDFKYSAVDIYAKKRKRFNMMEYMQRYKEYPQIEMFVKMGLSKIVDELVDCRCGLIKNEDAKNPADFLGINKSRMRQLIEVEGNTEALEAMQLERHFGENWTDTELNMVRETKMKGEDIKLALKYMSMRQLQNRIEKYTGVKMTEKPEETLCSHAAELIREKARIYFDYLHMRDQNGYDLNNTIMLYPRNLEEAHHKMVMEVNKKEIEKRDIEVMEKYKHIKTAYRKLRNRYFYEDEHLLIRPARNAAEIVKEGRELHHCVGGDNYLSKHNREESIILFLRLKGMEETPYITVEIREETIIQWYGANDKKPNKDEIDKWLQQYTEQLKDEKQITNIA